MIGDTATSSPSSRSTRSTRSTSPTRHTRSCSASSTCPATPPICTRSATSCCSASGRTSTRDERADRHAGLALRRLRPGAPDAALPMRRSARAGRRPSPTTTHSSTGPRPDSSSSRSASRPSRCRSPARRHQRARADRPDQARQSQLPQIDRSLVVGNTLLTVSSAGVASNRLTNLARLGWAAFPAPTPTPAPTPLPLPLP